MIYKSWRYNLTTLIFLSPWLLIFIVFQAYPVIYALVISLTDLKAIAILPTAFIGVNNYIKLLHDRNFQDAFVNSILFVLGTVPATMILAFFCSVFLNFSRGLRSVYNMAFFAPILTSTFVIAILFSQLYAADGLFNSVLEFFNLEPSRWHKHPDTSLGSIMIMSIWSSFGFYALVFLAALQTIPKEQYEMAKLEGAGFWRQISGIILPNLMPTILLMTLLNSILAFQMFGEVYIMTQGGPINSTKTVVYFIYDTAFSSQKMGYASAAAYFVFLFLLVVAIVQFSILKRLRNLNS